MPKTELAIQTYYKARHAKFGRTIAVLSAILSVMMTVSEARRADY